MTQMITVSELINAAIAAEDAAQHLYLSFKELFKHSEPVSDFWQTMADDEEKHARVLANVHGRIPVENLASTLDARLVAKAYALQGMDIPSLVETVRNLDDAYSVAYTLESSEINTIFNFLAIRFLPRDESYDILSSMIDTHLMRLAEFTRSFGDAEKCSRLAADRQA